MDAYNKQIFFNEKSRLKILLKPEFVSHIKQNSYPIKYYLEGGGGNLIFRDSIYKNGDSILIDYPSFPKNGEDIFFIPTLFDDKNYHIKLVANDKTGMEKFAEESIGIKDRKFDFKANTISDEKLFIGEKEESGKIRIQITTEGEAQGMNYILSYASEQKGKIRYKNKDYFPDEHIPVNAGTFEIEYIPETFAEGIHNLKFTLLDASKQTKTKNVYFKIYKEPEIKIVLLYRTKEKYSCNWQNDCKYRYKYFLNYDIIIDETAKLQTAKLEGFSLKDGNYIVIEKELKNYTNFNQEFKMYETDGGKPRPDWGANSYLILTFTDTKGREIKTEIKLVEE